MGRNRRFSPGFWVPILEGDQFKVNMGEKKLISKIDIEMYLTLLNNI